MTVQDLITGALRLLGIYAATETPEGEDLDDGLIVFNELIDNWNAQHLTVYTIVEYQLSLLATQGSYTMGVSGDFDYPRPVKIESAGIIQPNGIKLDLKLDTSKEWAEISEKQALAKLPLRLYNSNASPLTTLSLWPVPSANCVLDLWAWNQLDAGLLLNDTLDLPPGYLRPLRFNLAVALANEYGITPSPVITKTADESRIELFGLNASNFAGSQDPPQQAA